jgi:peptidoglycan hydrolase-like protein with peptidoglycan-binding domain
MKKIYSLLLAFITVMAFGFVSTRAQTVCVQGSVGCVTTQINVENFNTSNIKYPELCSVLNRTLKRGDVGEDVKRLQVVFGQEGISYINSTGSYSPITEKAVKTFQIRNGVYPAGKVGPQTLNLMRRLWCGGSNISPTPNPIPDSNGLQSINFTPTGSSGNNIVLSWTSKYLSDNSRNISYCILNGETFQGGNGTKSIPTVNETTYNLSCFDFSGRNYIKTVTVKPNQTVSNLPSLSVYINPSSVLIGQTATIYWNSQNTTYCSVRSSVGYGSDRADVSGSLPVTVSSNNQSFTVTCYNSNGQSASQTVYSNGNTTTEGITVGSQYSGTLNITVPKCQVPNGSIDWGDGTSRTSMNTADTSCIFNTSHNYSTNGTYTISVYNSSGNLVMTKIVTINTASGTGNQNLSLTLTADKTNVYNGENITFTATVRNNGNTIVRLMNEFGMCKPFQDVTFTTNAPFNTFVPESTPMCQPTPTNYPYSYINLLPGQTYSRTFVKSIFSANQNFGTYSGNAVLNIRNESGLISTVNSNLLNFTVAQVGTGGTSNVTVNTTNTYTGSSLNFSWNYNIGGGCISCGSGESPTGVIFDLIDANTNQVVGTIKRLPTYGQNDYANSGNLSWVVTKSLQDSRNDAIACTTINGENLCGNLIYSGNYKVRATFFTPSNACFGFCPQITGQKVLGTVESAAFYINSTLTQNTNVTLVSRVNGNVVLNLGQCSSGSIDWGDGTNRTSFMNEGSGCNFSHQYNGGLTQQFQIRVYSINNVQTGTLTVVPFPGV